MSKKKSRTNQKKELLKEVYKLYKKYNKTKNEDDKKNTLLKMNQLKNKLRAYYEKAY